MPFNDTTNKNGMIQRFEFWTRHADGEVTGTLLKTVTAGINLGFDRIMPRLLSYSDHIRWDDVNHGDAPIGFVQCNSGQPDYKITADDNSLDILNFVGVRILESASALEYQTLIRMLLDDPRAPDAMSPNPSVSGVPTHFLERGQFLFFYPVFNYTNALGIEITFEREKKVFVSTNTTEEAGVPQPFQELPVLYHARDWVAVNRSKDRNLRNLIDLEILKQEQNLDDLIGLRNPTKAGFRASQNAADSSR